MALGESAAEAAPAMKAGAQMDAAGMGGGMGGAEGAGPPAAPRIDLSKVSARQNLNETAFFFPHLTAGEDGKVTMKFTMPEALTEWKFLGFAHDAHTAQRFPDRHGRHVQGPDGRTARAAIRPGRRRDWNSR